MTAPARTLAPSQEATLEALAVDDPYARVVGWQHETGAPAILSDGRRLVITRRGAVREEAA